MCNWCEVIARRYAAVGRVPVWNGQFFSSSERHSLCAQSSTPTSGYQLAARESPGWHGLYSAGGADDAGQAGGGPW